MKKSAIQHYFSFKALFNVVLVLKVTDLLFGLTSNVPNPTKVTFSPLVKDFWISSIIQSNATIVCVLVSPEETRTFSTSSFLFTLFTHSHYTQMHLIRQYESQKAGKAGSGIDVTLQALDNNLFITLGDHSIHAILFYL